MQTSDAMASGEYDAKFRLGLEQFNARLFFNAHESWEEIWLSSSQPNKTFLQGIIQVAAAFHHYKNDNLRGTRSLLEAGLRRLEPFPAGHHGIALEALRESARDWVAALAADSDLGSGRIPQIALLEDD